MLKRISVLGALLALSAFSSCNSTTVVYQPAPTPGGGGGGCTYNCGGGGPYYTAWYDVYGNYCGNTSPMPGCNFYSDGTKIQDYEDPYYANKYLQYSSDWTYTDSYGYTQNYSGYAWLSSDGILFDDFGNALNEVGQNAGHDLLGEAADLEAQAIDGAGASLASRFALASDRAVEIARTLNDWAVLGKSRARTANDVADYGQRLYGVNMTTAQAALQSAAQGNTDALQAVNAQVAAYWGTNPETSQAILATWYAGQYQVK
jgi:hypothetical protein